MTSKTKPFQKLYIKFKFDYQSVLEMALFSNYKVLPYSVTCDTVFLCYNPYYDIQFKQCYQFKDILPLIEQTPTTYKIILLAETFDEGLNQIAKINRLKQMKEESLTREDNSQEQDEDIKDKLGTLGAALEHSQQNKSSFLHLKCLLNKTQAKISTLDKQVRQKFEKQTTIKLDKKTKKYNKIQQKQLESLRQKQSNLQRQISNEQNRLWWQQQSKQFFHSESQQQSNEDLLSDYEQKKENKVYL